MGTDAPTSITIPAGMTGDMRQLLETHLARLEEDRAASIADYDRRIGEIRVMLKSLRADIASFNFNADVPSAKKRRPRGQNFERIKLFFNDKRLGKFTVADVSKALELPHSSVQAILSNDKKIAKMGVRRDDNGRYSLYAPHGSRIPPEQIAAKFYGGGPAHEINKPE